MRQNIAPIDKDVAFDLAAGLVAASATLTSDQTEVTAGDTVTLSDRVYTFVDDLTVAVAATATLTSDVTKPATGDTVTIGDQTYTFKTALTPVYGGVRSYIPNQVKIGADTDETLTNLAAAVNGTGVAGTNYSLGTEFNPLVSSAAVSTNALVMTARSTGTGGNSIAKSEDSLHLDWDGAGAVFTGGVDTVVDEVIIAAYAVGTVTSTTNGNPSDAETIVIGNKTYTFKTTLGAVANQIKIGANGEATLNNLRAAINLTGTPGTEYGVGTTINTQVSAPTAAALNVTDYDLALTSKVAGTAGEYVLTESATNITVSGSGTLDFTASTNSDPDETLGNLVEAINGTGTAGVEYSIGTTANADVSAAAVSSNASIMTARTAGVAGNTIAKAESSTHLDWDGAGAVFTAGGSTKGQYTFTKAGVARRFILTLGDITGTGTLGASLYNAAGVLIKAIQATQAQAAATDTAYEVEVAPGDYIVFTMSAAVSDLETVHLSVR